MEPNPQQGILQAQLQQPISNGVVGEQGQFTEFQSGDPSPSDSPPPPEEDTDKPTVEKKAGRRKINIEFINEKSRRHITFSKRKTGIMKKAFELSTLTGTQVLLLVASETGHVYTFATPKLQPLITKPEGKQLIQTCLNAPDTPAEQYPNSNGSNNNHNNNNYPEEKPRPIPVKAEKNPPILNAVQQEIQAQQQSSQSRAYNVAPIQTQPQPIQSIQQQQGVPPNLVGYGQVPSAEVLLYQQTQQAKQMSMTSQPQIISTQSMPTTPTGAPLLTSMPPSSPGSSTPSNYLPSFSPYASSPSTYASNVYPPPSQQQYQQQQQPPQQQQQQQRYTNPNIPQLNAMSPSKDTYTN